MKINYRRMADDLINVGKHLTLAHRYLSIRRRLLIARSAPRPLRWRTHCVISRLLVQRNWLHEQLRLAVNPVSTARFAAVVSRDTVLAALENTDPAADNLSTLLAFNHNVGMLVNGRAVETTWGVGSGIAVIWRPDLMRLLAGAKMALTIECYADYWVGWMDSGPAGAPEGFTQRKIQFHYYAQPMKTP